MAIDNAIERALRQRLESLRDAGVRQLPRKATLRPAPDQPAPPEDPLPAADRPVTPRAAAASGSPPADPERQPATRNQAAPLELLAEEVAQCTRCEELACTRTQTVFGSGDPGARLCFLGEAPGADEDRLGEPFVGRAGQLLTKMLAACGFHREDVYTLNILKCRPPANRNPTPTEANNCRGFLMRQLELIQPEFICCLGAVAAQNLLETDTAIGKLRGRVHDYRGIRVICTYHPSYLLRTPSAKGPAWEDLQMLLREMGIRVPQRN